MSSFALKLYYWFLSKLEQKESLWTGPVRSCQTLLLWSEQLCFVSNSWNPDAIQHAKSMQHIHISVTRYLSHLFISFLATYILCTSSNYYIKRGFLVIWCHVLLPSEKICFMFIFEEKSWFLIFRYIYILMLIKWWC